MTAAQVDEALRLIDEGRTLLKHGQADRALWRLVDAVGLAAPSAKAMTTGPLAGLDEPTGRGFRVVIEDDNDEGTTT